MFPTVEVPTICTRETVLYNRLRVWQPGSPSLYTPKHSRAEVDTLSMHTANTVNSAALSQVRSALWMTHSMLEQRNCG